MSQSVTRMLKAQATMLAMLPGWPEPVRGMPHFGLMPTGAVVVSKDAPKSAAGARC
jgi:hypothetical protein